MFKSSRFHALEFHQIISKSDYGTSELLQMSDWNMSTLSMILSLSPSARHCYSCQNEHTFVSLCAVLCVYAYKVYFVLLYVRSKHKHDGRPIQMRWCVFYTVWRFYTTFSLLNSNPKIIVTQTIKQKNLY